jgi:DnaK suppressor protein
MTATTSVSWDLDHLRELLHQEKQETLAHIAQVESELEATLEQPDAPLEVQFDEESGEGAATNVDVDRNRALLAALRHKLSEIEEAFSRMEDGTYGFCEHCGEPISAERLEAMPTARSCVRCKAGGLWARVRR